MTDRSPWRRSSDPRSSPGLAKRQRAEAAKKALWGPTHAGRFRHDLQGGNVLQVRALPAERSHTRIARWVSSAYRRSADWFRRWSAFRGSRPRRSIQLWLSEEDSRLLFWSLPKRVSHSLSRGWGHICKIETANWLDSIGARERRPLPWTGAITLSDYCGFVTRRRAVNRPACGPSPDLGYDRSSTPR